MKYRPHTSPSLLETAATVWDYPARWELLLWYRCLRKYPYPSDVIAAIMAGERSKEYSHYPCRVSPEHWHIGRGHNKADPSKLLSRAKRSYRKAVRDEVIERHERKQRVVEQERVSA